MFICKTCAEKEKLGTWHPVKSYGPCEFCSQTALCFDIPSHWIAAQQQRQKRENP